MNESRPKFPRASGRVADGMRTRFPGAARSKVAIGLRLLRASGAVLLGGVLLAVTPLCAAPGPHVLLLDGVLAGHAVLAVGERGAILHSTDGARSWESTKPSTLATLTGVSFADADHGWAVGHDAVILATRDGGLTWTRQWQGRNLSDSFLDVVALDRQRVIAVGAYGLYVTTEDAGVTWAQRKIIDEDYHLNRITRGKAGTLYLAGEHGTLLRSADRGVTWRAISAPYDGSFYGILPLRSGTLVAYGLRGRVYRSVDDGAAWTGIATGETELIATGVESADHMIVLAGQARGLLVSRDDGRSYEQCDIGVTTGIAELLALSDSELLALGEAGATRIAASRLIPDSAKPREQSSAPPPKRADASGDGI